MKLWSWTESHTQIKREAIFKKCLIAWCPWQPKWWAIQSPSSASHVCTVLSTSILNIAFKNNLCFQWLCVPLMCYWSPGVLIGSHFILNLHRAESYPLPPSLHCHFRNLCIVIVPPTFFAVCVLPCCVCNATWPPLTKTGGKKQQGYSSHLLRVDEWSCCWCWIRANTNLALWVNLPFYDLQMMWISSVESKSSHSPPQTFPFAR